MSFVISVSKSVSEDDISFDCEPGETVLNAAERAGYVIPYSCRKGVCSSCEGRIVSGQAQVRGQGNCTGPSDGIYLCQAKPTSDIEIAPLRIHKDEPVARKIFEAKVHKVENPGAGVSIIQLRFPIGNRAVFKAGQYLRIILDDDDSRNYSMANPPHKNNCVELHIRHVPNGKFSEGILVGLQKGDLLNVELPYGGFSLSDNDEIPAILMATGTGFAPIRSIVEHQIKIGAKRQIHLYWGGNTEADLYLNSLAEKWAEKHAWFSYTPVISNPSSQWAGDTGFVHLTTIKDNPDMSGAEVYACGAPKMIDAARESFSKECELKAENFYSDAFEPSAMVRCSVPASGGSDLR